MFDETNTTDAKTYDLCVRALSEFHIEPMCKWARVAIISCNDDIQKELPTKEMLSLLKKASLDPEQDKYREIEDKIVEFLAQIIKRLDIDEGGIIGTINQIKTSNAET